MRLPIRRQFTGWEFRNYDVSHKICILPARFPTKGGENKTKKYQINFKYTIKQAKNKLNKLKLISSRDTYIKVQLYCCSEQHYISIPMRYIYYLCTVLHIYVYYIKLAFANPPAKQTLWLKPQLSINVLGKSLTYFLNCIIIFEMEGLKFFFLQNKKYFPSNVRIVFWATTKILWALTYGDDNGRATGRDCDHSHCGSRLRRLGALLVRVYRTKRRLHHATYIIS